jgi:transcriptional regulator with AAA-type ATPase domain
MARRIGDDLKYTKATLMLGVKETKSGNLLSAEKHLLEARVTAERRNYQREIALADEFIGDLMFERGDLEDALENYAISMKAATRINPKGDIVAEVQRRMMNVYLFQRKAEETLAIGRRAVETCRASGEMHEIGYIERMIGQALAIQKKEPEAEKQINMSIRTFLSVNNPYEAHRSGVILGEQLLRRGDRRSAVMARKLISETVSYFERNEDYSDLARSHFLLARIEDILGNRDECLLHLFDAQRLAEELHDRNLTRRLRRMRRKIEDAAAGPQGVPAGGDHAGEVSGSFVHDPQLKSYLDYILSDLMRKLADGHAFVALTDGNGSEPVVLARRGIDEASTRAITSWFLGREDTDLSEKFLVTDTANDRRVRDILGELPGGDSPAYFHPLRRGGMESGLLFFQAEGNEGAPAVGSIFEIVSTYAGFIDFLIRGSVEGVMPVPGGKSAAGSGFYGIITGDEKMLRIMELAGKVAASDSTVLLMGETGTGKGLVAQAIHDLSRRRDKKFIHVNCAALPEMILESELFGHVKGSFTGAVADKKGLLAEANGGTIFLDEIGKAPLPIQGKLLQFLDTRRVRPVGSNEMSEVDVRLIFASKADLLGLCASGRMLEDFYYRINDFPLTIPPLRERRADIPVLADHYLREFCSEMDKKIIGFSDDAVEFLKGCDWPGNVRELGKIIKRAVILSDDNGVITPQQLIFDLAGDFEGQAAVSSTLPDMVSDLERRVVSEALEKNDWNRKAAAADLGISYPTLLKKIRDFGIVK